MAWQQGEHITVASVFIPATCAECTWALMPQVRAAQNVSLCLIVPSAERPSGAGPCFDCMLRLQSQQCQPDKPIAACCCSDYMPCTSCM